MIVYIYNIGVDLYNGFNGLRHRINWTYFTVLDGLAHPLYSPLEVELILTLITWKHGLQRIHMLKQAYMANAHGLVGEDSMNYTAMTQALLVMDRIV